MRCQEKLQGSTVQLEELKWKCRMPKQVEPHFFLQKSILRYFSLEVKEEVS